MTELLDEGRAEALKAGWHGAILALASGALVYNTAACVRRPSKHLAFGAVVYTLLVGIEVGMVARHLKSRSDYAE